MNVFSFLRGVTTISHTTEYVNVLKQRQVETSLAAVGKAGENGYAELVIRTIKEEEVALYEYPALTSAKLHLRRFIDKVYQM